MCACAHTAAVMRWLEEQEVSSRRQGAANNKRTNKEPKKQLKEIQGEYAPSHRASTPPTPHAAVTSGPLEVGSWWLHARPGDCGEETQGAVFALMGLID